MQMFVTFDEYSDFGYDLIPEKKFDRFIYRAGQMVSAWTLQRVTDEKLNDDPADDGYLCVQKTDAQRKLAERNKRGICEVAELFFKRENLGVGEAGVALAGFKNEGYSETFANTSAEESAAILERDVLAILDVFFTREQLYRGGGGGDVRLQRPDNDMASVEG